MDGLWVKYALDHDEDLEMQRSFHATGVPVAAGGWQVLNTIVLSVTVGWGVHQAAAFQLQHTIFGEMFVPMLPTRYP